MTSAAYQDFDEAIDRTGTSSLKWRYYEGKPVLPFLFADMEFRTPGFVLEAIEEKLRAGLLGYEVSSPALDTAIVDWAERNFQWKIEPDWLVWMPSVVSGLNFAIRAVMSGPGSILVNTPIYPKILHAPHFARQTCVPVEMVQEAGRWVVDFDKMEAAVKPDTQLLLFCNPQNPTGRVFDRAELEEIVAFCQRHDLYLCTDEIHCPLILTEGKTHIPIASIDPDFRDRVITLTSMTKAYNLQGAGCSVAIISDAKLRQKFQTNVKGLTPPPGALGYAAAEAAFGDQTGWLDGLLTYLRSNQARVAQFVEDQPGLSMTLSEGTFLAWIDARALEFEGDIEQHFVSHGAGIADGKGFGREGFIRLNFACPRSMLDEGLNRISQGIDAL